MNEDGGKQVLQDTGKPAPPQHSHYPRTETRVLFVFTFSHNSNNSQMSATFKSKHALLVRFHIKAREKVKMLKKKQSFHVLLRQHPLSCFYCLMQGFPTGVSRHPGVLRGTRCVMKLKKIKIKIKNKK
jgi:hypothetical protein